MIEVGYMPKLVRSRPEWLAATSVEEICSVSHCISDPPVGWIEQWLHNDLGLYNSLDAARSVIPAPVRGEFRIFGYRMYPEFFRAGSPELVSLPEDVRPEPIPLRFKSLGFDAASRSRADVLGFECSPLSCNAMAQEVAVNRHCLVPSLAEALAVARRFSVEQPEPGDYYVVEVLEAG